MTCGGGVGVVEIGEILAGDERNAHHREVAWRDRVRERLVEPGLGAHPAVDREHARGQAVDVERHRRGDRGALDRRQRAEPLEEPGRKRPREPVVGAAAGQVVGREQHALAPEARVGVARLEKAAEKESRRDEHDQRQRDLDRHERVAQAAAAARRGPGAERELRIQTRQLKCRRRPEDRAAQDAQRHREHEAGHVDVRLEVDREADGQRHRGERPRSPDADRDAKRRRR